MRFSPTLYRLLLHPPTPGGTLPAWRKPSHCSTFPQPVGSVTGSLPAAFLLFTSMIVAVGTFARFRPTDVWGSRTSATVLLVLLLAVPVTASFYPKRFNPCPTAGGDIPAVVSSFIVTAVEGHITVLVLPFQVWSRVGSISSDFTRHLIFVGKYSRKRKPQLWNRNRDDAYPRAAIMRW